MKVRKGTQLLINPKATRMFLLRTNVLTLDERTTWDYYNLIREIECAIRQLKTDLNLRPIYDQKDSKLDTPPGKPPRYTGCYT